MSILEITSSEDIKKLIGCHIHDARIVQDGTSGHLELQVNHINMPNKVKLEIRPEVSFSVGVKGISIFAGLSIKTDDLKEEKVE